jgi:monofunctional biosynthetic peptidoglycan transglycosylase
MAIFSSILKTTFAGLTKATLMFLGLMGLLLIFAAVELGIILSTLPSPKEIRGCMITKMFEVSLCPGSKQYVSYNQISSYVKHAILISEDASFFSHKGFDWDELQNSFKKNMAAGRYARGGSTLTQQLAKNMFLSKDKTIWRKAKEAIITTRLEKTLSKREIFERYLNVVQFGPKIFGIKQASQFYFHKSPSELNVTESAFLAFLLPSPEKYSYSFFRKELTQFARKRMRSIITGLWQTGHVSEDVYNSAIANLIYFPNVVPDLPLVESKDSTIPTLEDLEAAERDSGVTPEQETSNDVATEIKEPTEVNKPPQDLSNIPSDSDPTLDESDNQTPAK